MKYFERLVVGDKWSKGWAACYRDEKSQAD
jgi:hypothetical protein